MVLVLFQVEMIMQWASRLGYEFAASTPGPAGLTPLHLAVLLPDGGSMAALLTGGYMHFCLFCYVWLSFPGCFCVAVRGLVGDVHPCTSV
jgi:hypothetical protein